MRIQKRQSGNVLFLIFIAIGLFAALSYAVSGSMRGGENQLSDQQARLAASEIIAYHADVRRVVQQLQQWGCSENDFDFVHPSIMRINGAVWQDRSPTARQSCRLYESPGGGFSPKTFSSYSITLSDVIDSTVGVPGTSNVAHGRILGIGSDSGSDLTFNTGRLRSEVCSAINRQLKINDGQPISANPGSFWVGYNGAFGNWPDYMIGKPGEEAAAGKSAFCIVSPDARLAGGIQYRFISVLIPR